MTGNNSISAEASKTDKALRILCSIENLSSILQHATALKNRLGIRNAEPVEDTMAEKSPQRNESLLTVVTHAADDLDLIGQKMHVILEEIERELLG